MVGGGVLPTGLLDRDRDKDRDSATAVLASSSSLLLSLSLPTSDTVKIFLHSLTRRYWPQEQEQWNVVTRHKHKPAGSSSAATTAQGQQRFQNSPFGHSSRSRSDAQVKELVRGAVTVMEGGRRVTVNLANQDLEDGDVCAAMLTLKDVSA